MKVVCTVSKRKEVTSGPVYEMFRKVLRESCQPCPYFKTVKSLKAALIADAVEKEKGNKTRAAKRLKIHRNNFRYIEKTLAIEVEKPKPPASENRIERMYRLAGRIAELKRVMA